MVIVIFSKEVTRLIFYNSYTAISYYIFVGVIFLFVGLIIIECRNDPLYLGEILKLLLAVVSVLLFCLITCIKFKFFIVGCNLSLYSVFLLIKIKDQLSLARVKKSKKRGDFRK